MDRITINANRMKVQDGDPQTNMTRDGLDPFFVTERTTITVGVSGGTCEGPLDFVPKESEFYERRVVSKSVQWEAACEGSATPKGSIKYQQRSQHSEEMTPITIGLWPDQFGSGLPGCYRWQYTVLGGHQTAMECSHDSPPVHKAKFLYDARQSRNFPDYVHANVRTEFKISKNFR